MKVHCSQLLESVLRGTSLLMSGMNVSVGRVMKENKVPGLSSECR